MKVKVGDKVYEDERTILMVILTREDKERIASMAQEATKYCCFPKGTKTSEIETFMVTDHDLVGTGGYVAR